MVKLTTEIFNESCCDGGSTTMGHNSTMPCGCDMGATPPHYCAQHKVDTLDDIKSDVHYILKHVKIGDDITHEVFGRLYRWSKS